MQVTTTNKHRPFFKIDANIEKFWRNHERPPASLMLQYCGQVETVPRYAGLGFIVNDPSRNTAGHWLALSPASTCRLMT